MAHTPSDVDFSGTVMETFIRDITHIHLLGNGRVCLSNYAKLAGVNMQTWKLCLRGQTDKHL